MIMKYLPLVGHLKFFANSLWVMMICGKVGTENGDYITTLLFSHVY